MKTTLLPSLLLAGLLFGSLAPAQAQTILLQIDYQNAPIFHVLDDGRLQLPTGAADGYVLTTDSDGYATWQAVSGSGGAVTSDATLTGDGTAGMPLGVSVPLVLTGSANDGVVRGAHSGGSEGQLGGSIYGVRGTSITGTGVIGSSTNATGISGSSINAIGVSGSSSSNTGVSGGSATGIGVRGSSGSSFGVYGLSGSNTGVYGESDNGTGVVGTSTSHTGVSGTTGTGTGVRGVSDSGYGIYGFSVSSNGVYGSSTNSFGVRGFSTSSTGILGTSTSSNGIRGESDTGVGVSGFSPSGIGVRGSTVSGNAVYGVNGSNWGALGSDNFAGTFNGNVLVAGTLSKSGGSFKIDHPLDPAGKYLSHSFVESPDMMNVYNGNVITDAEGEAVITLPDYFETLNRDFRYQLTTIGGFAPVYIAEKVSGNTFKIAGGTPGMEISWQVTGIRQDAWAEANRIVVEEDKPTDERGYYLNPAVFGQPPERSIEWARDPEGMRKMQEMPARMEEEQRQIEQDQARLDKEAARMREAREEN